VRQIRVFKAELQTKVVCRFKINTYHLTVDEFHFAESGGFNGNQTQIAVDKFAVQKGDFRKGACVKNAVIKNTFFIFRLLKRVLGKIYFRECLVGNTRHERMNCLMMCSVSFLASSRSVLTTVTSN